eukprot:5779728-Amphidinium_carterae.3
MMKKSAFLINCARGPVVKDTSPHPVARGLASRTEYDLSRSLQDRNSMRWQSQWKQRKMAGISSEPFLSHHMEEDLIKELNAGTIAGAALDVQDRRHQSL